MRGWDSAGTGCRWRFGKIWSEMARELRANIACVYVVDPEGYTFGKLKWASVMGSYAFCEQEHAGLWYRYLIYECVYAYAKDERERAHSLE